MTGPQVKLPRGTLFRGEDGRIYFVPEGRLLEFQLSEEEAAQAQQLIEGEAEVQGYQFTPSRLTPLGDVQFPPTSSGDTLADTAT